MSDPLPPTAEKKTKGCWFYGCLTLVVLGALAGVGTFFTARYLVRQVSVLVEKYTETSATPLQPVKLTSEERKALHERVNTFTGALRAAGAQGAELSLTGDELNALLQDSPGIGPIANQVRVRIEQGILSGSLSWPLDNLGPLKQSGRFLNGEAAIQVSLSNGLLKVSLSDFKFHGQSLPATVLTGLRGVNFAEGAQKDPKFREALQRFESVEVKGDRMLIRSRPAAQ